LGGWTFTLEGHTYVASLRMLSRVAVVPYVAVDEGVECVVFAYADVFAWEPFCAWGGVMLIGTLAGWMGSAHTSLLEYYVSGDDIFTCCFLRA